jgi:para-aminobenzoate synthetase/4-amino-4-deoxychorismate lyase
MTVLKPFSDNALRSLLAGHAANDSFVFLESTRVSPENHRSFLFTNPVDRLVFHPGDDPVSFFSRAQEKHQQGFFLAGYVSYEFGYLLEPILAKSFQPRPACRSLNSLPLADLGVFKKPYIFDHFNKDFQDNELWPAENEPAPDQNFSIEQLRLNLRKEEYLKAVNRIKSYIEAGDTYQVNFTLKLLFEFAGSVPEFYCSLRRNQSVSYGGLIKNGETSILTFSPELFFRRKGNTITVRPMKGTMLRGRTVAEDKEFSSFLHHDIKNRAENVMIVDLLRNDLGRLSRMGGVSVQSLFDVETYETLHQMTSSIKGVLNKPISLEELFKALFPCGSVTGAPKIRTMEIIRELEAEDRGVYTGAIGYIGPDGEAVFNVPIRTVVLQDQKGEMGIGSGIVWDSDVVGEWEECILKGRFLTTPAPEFRLIETLLWNPDSGYWLLDLHLKRLAESAGYFFYPFDHDTIMTELQRLAEDFSSKGSEKSQRVRLTLSKEGEIELTATALDRGPFPAIDTESILRSGHADDSPRVIFSNLNTDSGSPYLFHKTPLRKFYDDELSQAVARGFFEVLFINEKGEVTEGSYTNIFLLREGRLITPPVSCGLLPGVFRSHLLQEYPSLVQETSISRRDIKQADAVFVGNSVRASGDW